MLEANADKDKATEDGVAPLIIAAYTRQVKVVRLLLGANAKRTRPGKMVPPPCSSQLKLDSRRLYGFCWRPMRTRKRPWKTVALSSSSPLRLDSRRDKDKTQSGATLSFIANEIVL